MRTGHLRWVALLALSAGVMAGLSWERFPEPSLAEGASAQAAAAVSVPATLPDLYGEWQPRYLAAGGDRRVRVVLGRSRGLSRPSRPAVHRYGAARGEVEIDLLAGRLRARVQGLEEPADLWLVDNLPAPGRSALPDPGDRFLLAGRLLPHGGEADLSVELGEQLFTAFELDLVVVTPAGAHPLAGGLLFGSRSAFERRFSRLRRALETTLGRSQQLSRLPALLVPGALLGGRSAASVPRSDRVIGLSPEMSPLVTAGLLSAEVAAGADLFFRETFAGNGRTCATCHRAERNLVIDADLIAGLPADDPLFVAERPVEEGGVPGLEVPELLRGFGLILENVDGAEDPTVKRVMRGIPHAISLLASIRAPKDDLRAPVERTGWSGDGAPMSGALRFFTLGAVFQHFTRSLERVEGVDFRAPTDEELDAVELYLLTVGRMEQRRLAALVLEDPRAEAGREVFLGDGKCFRCHLDAGAISGFGGNRNFDTGLEKLEHPARHRVDFPLDGGFGTDPFDTDGDGQVDSFGDGTFNIPTLVEAADTGPFFHNNVLETLEDAVAFYASELFNASPAGDFIGQIDLSEEQIDQVAIFLRVLNGAFNIDLAAQRASAARAVLVGGLEGVPVRAGDGSPAAGRSFEAMRGSADRLLELAESEIRDAMRVLGERDLHPEAVQGLERALEHSQRARGTGSPREWLREVEACFGDLEASGPFLSRNLLYVLGEGNLAF